METITITKRYSGTKVVYNKRFDDYEDGYYGRRISKKEYEDSKAKNEANIFHKEDCLALNIIERITYGN